MFSRLDTDGDRRLGIEEFKRVLPTLDKWGVKIYDPDATFKVIDSNGGGWVLFDEFCIWAAAQNMDIDDDDDFISSDKPNTSISSVASVTLPNSRVSSLLSAIKNRSGSKSGRNLLN